MLYALIDAVVASKGGVIGIKNGDVFACWHIKLIIGVGGGGVEAKNK